MKVLWIVNIEFPEAVSLLDKKSELKSTGGWLLGAAESITSVDSSLKLTICSVSKRVKKLTQLCGKKYNYYLIPYGRGNLFYNSEYERCWKEIKKEIDPDVVHIHGTEFTHGLSYVRSCGNHNVVVSIQGLKSAYSHYYYYGMTLSEIFRNLTLRDLFKGGILTGKRRFERSGSFETELIGSVNHIIGRTSWDRARTWAINPNAQYHFCNETLRSDFYDNSRWKYDSCRKHSIFVTQAGYPIKGFHMLLKAMPIILAHYPDAQIRLAGNDITRNQSVSDLFRYSGYGCFINKLIRKYNLTSHVTFLGNLNAAEMKNEYLNCNVFVSPSTIENSPNSIGEAQILGTPVIASYVGGVMDMIPSDIYGSLYRFDEIEMLAYKICTLFGQTSMLTQNACIELAYKRHDPSENAANLLSIYEQIIDDNAI